MNLLKAIQKRIDRFVMWWHRRQFSKIMKAKNMGYAYVGVSLNPIDVQRFDGKSLPTIKLRMAEGERVRATFMPGEGMHCPQSQLFFDEKAKVE